MHAKHEGNTLSDPNVCKTLGESQVADFPARPGQLPHSHIGELEIYAKHEGDTPSELNV